MARLQLSGVVGMFVLLCASPAMAQEEKPANGFQFRWDIPCRVRVMEKTEKKGNTAELTYDLHVTRMDDGRLKIARENIKILKINGIDLTTPEAQKTYAPLMIASTLAPSFVVSSDGVFNDIVDIEKCIDNTIAYLKTLRKPEETDAKWQAAEKMMRSPQMIAQLKVKCADPWNLWVGAWIGVDLKTGEHQKTTDETPLFGTSAVGALTLTNHGPAEGNKDAIRLSGIKILEGPEILQELAKNFMEIARSFAPEMKSPDKDDLKDFKLESRFEAVVIPAILKPLSASNHMTATISLKDGKNLTSKESKEYTFDWSIDKPDEKK